MAAKYWSSTKSTRRSPDSHFEMKDCSFLGGFLGLGRATAFAFLPLRLKLPKILGTSLSDLPRTFPSKRDGGGILLVYQMRFF